MARRVDFSSDDEAGPSSPAALGAPRMQPGTAGVGPQVVADSLPHGGHARPEPATIPALAGKRLKIIRKKADSRHAPEPPQGRFGTSPGSDEVLDGRLKLLCRFRVPQFQEFADSYEHLQGT